MRIQANKVHAWVTRAVVQHPNDLAQVFQQEFCVTRATAAKWLRKLEDENWVSRVGTTRPTWSPGDRRLLVSGYSLPGIDETLCWSEDFAPYLRLPTNIFGIADHAFTELLNNTNDHSGGARVRAGVLQTANRLFISIHDDGMGVFERIAQGLNLPARGMALLELSKGKCTTDPTRHTGEGIFFTSRMFDRFTLEANDLIYTHDRALKHDWLVERDIALKQGTRVRMSIRLDSLRTMKKVFDEYTSADGDFCFNRTVVPVRLVRLGTENLFSRSQGKRLVQRFDQFRVVILDFEDVPGVGQAFADEVFRVYRSKNPNVELRVINANEDVRHMLVRAGAPVD